MRRPSSSEAAPGWFHDVSWHPDGARLAAASSDGQIWIWDATRGFERDTTPRALPYIDRKVASGTARGEDLCWYAESYIRAGKPRKAMAVVRADRDRLRELLAKLPAEQRTAFARLWAEDAKTAGPANNAERLAFAQIAYDLERFAFSTRLWAERWQATRNSVTTVGRSPATTPPVPQPWPQPGKAEMSRRSTK